VKEFLTAKGVPFTNRDIAGDEAAMRELQDRVPGAATVPVILVADEVIMGFDRTKLQKALGLQ
jgi:glutaredoxin